MKRPRVVATIESRMGSTRLPKKTLMPILGEPLIWRVVERVRAARSVDEVVIATTTSPKDDVLESFCSERGIACYRGSEDDVLGRVVEAAKLHGAEVVVQLGADCPLYDPAQIDELVGIFLKGGYHYVANDMKLTYPEGIDAHVIDMASLVEAAAKATRPQQREDTPRYLWDHPERFKIFNREAPKELTRPDIRVTVDYPEDFTVVEKVYAALYPKNPRFSTKDVIALFDRQPELLKINAHCEQRSAAYVPEKS
jgi:spore coat polysaccharide biosynthesis protein SpsF